MRPSIGSAACLAVATAMIMAGHASAARRSPDYALDAAGRRVVAMSNLEPDDRCSPALTRGRIVRREMDRSGFVSSLVLEAKDGSRETVNVSPSLKTLGASDRAWLSKGLKALLRLDTIVDIGIRLCGAGGRVVMLDSVRAP